MAQVLVDQHSNGQSILKRKLYKSLGAVYNPDDFNSGESSSTSTTLSSAPDLSKFGNEIVSPNEEFVNLGFSDTEQSTDCINLDDSSSCDDPVVVQSETEDLPSVTVIEQIKKKTKGFSCSVCGHNASSFQRLKEHLSHHTGVKHLECKICGKKFGWRYSFKSHMASHREDNPNKCTICGKRYCNKSAVKNHMLRIHGNPSRDFKCEKCDKCFVTKAELERHSFNHSKEKPFVCEYCGNAYRYKGALVVHYRVHSGEKPYKCGFCDKSFIHLSSFIGHRRRHTGETPFQCKECGKFFRVKRALTAHMLVHSENKPFKCNECGKGFKSRSGYRVHLDFHLDIKRHSCKYCGRTFRAWCNMHKHMKRHLGEKPHKCDLCNKTFVEKQELKSHMKSHENNKNSDAELMLDDQCIVTTCTDILPVPTLTCSTPNIDSPPAFSDTQQSNDMLSSHIDISENQAVMYDCNLTSSIDKCTDDKCQLLPDSYVSQFLYPETPAVHYAPHTLPVPNMYSTDAEQMAQRSACMSNMNPVNFNCVQLNNQNYSNYAYNMPNSDEILSKCKLCRSFFNSTLILRSHLLDYHRIEEENVDELFT